MLAIMNFIKLPLFYKNLYCGEKYSKIEIRFTDKVFCEMR